MNLKENQKVWIVTGSSSGLGRSFVKAIVQQGDFAAAMARNKESIGDLVNQYPDQIMALNLDETDPAQIQERCHHQYFFYCSREYICGQRILRCIKMCFGRHVQCFAEGNSTIGNQGHGRRAGSFPYGFQRTFFKAECFAD